MSLLTGFPGRVAARRRDKKFTGAQIELDLGGSIKFLLRVHG